MSYFFDRIDKDSGNYKQGVVDCRSEMSGQIFDLQNQLQAANAKILRMQATGGRGAASGEQSRTAVLADRGRVRQIMTAGVSKYRQEHALTLACNTDLSLDQASAILSGLPETKPEQRKSAFELHMEKLGNPDIDPSWPEDEPDETVEGLAAAIAAVNNRYSGRGNPVRSGG